VRKVVSSGLNPEDLTYRLFDVKVSSFHTASGADQPHDTITLSFTKIEEDYLPENPDGTPGTPIRVSYDLAQATGGTPSINRSDWRGARRPLGVTFQVAEGPISPEIEVQSFQWDAAAGVTPRLHDFQLDLGSPGSAEPQVWGVLARGTTFHQVTLHVRKVVS